MTITPAATTPAASTSTTNPSASLNQLSGNFATFLTLLTTQLKNQDPTAPMDSNTFTQQLVMYSQVEQQINTNTNLQTLITQGTSNAAAVTTGYLGKSVSITNGNASLTGGTATWNYNLGATAASSTLTVTNAQGTVVYTGPGQTSQGNNGFTWNGQDTHGNQLPDGTYQLAVSASDSNGTAITSSVSSTGTVSGVDMTGGTPKLIIGTMEVNLADISTVAN